MNIIQIGAKVGPGEGIGVGNAGDTAIGDAFSYLFEKEFPNATIRFMNCRKNFTIDDVEEINKNDLLIVSGGGLFLFDTYKNQTSDWQWGISNELLSKINIPIIVYAVGYNKFRGQRNFNSLFNQTIETLIKKSIFFSLRNTGSCTSVEKHVSNFFHDKIKLNFCPTMQLRKKYNFNLPRSKSVGFVLAGDRLSNRHKNLEIFIEQIKIFVDYLKRKNIETVLINHLNDDWISKHILFDRHVDLYQKPSEEIYRFYSTMDVIIPDRGHGQMIPLACGCKIITPVSHNKLSWFLKDMDLLDFAVDESDSQLGRKLIEKFEKLSTINWQQIHLKCLDIVDKNYSVNMKQIKLKLN
jgi:polysaccharide pyruvyl transferase WcaK-like protein